MFISYGLSIKFSLCSIALFYNINVFGAMANRDLMLFSKRNLTAFKQTHSLLSRADRVVSKGYKSQFEGAGQCWDNLNIKKKVCN